MEEQLLNDAAQGLVHLTGVGNVSVWTEQVYIA
ncbi:hypothetical protein CTP10_R80290 (plasmid) [Cupriavidus sp. P-10]|nr:hypothetical protein CTP10_R80290 [Cupriavidus sp. P-10]